MGGLNEKFLNIEAGGTYSNHHAVNRWCTGLI